MKDLVAVTVDIDRIVCRMAGARTKKESGGTPPAFGQFLSRHCSAGNFFSQDA